AREDVRRAYGGERDHEVKRGTDHVAARHDAEGGHGTDHSDDREGDLRRRHAAPPADPSRAALIAADLARPSAIRRSAPLASCSARTRSYVAWSGSTSTRGGRGAGAASVAAAVSACTCGSAAAAPAGVTAGPGAAAGAMGAADVAAGAGAGSAPSSGSGGGRTV